MSFISCCTLSFVITFTDIEEGLPNEDDASTEESLLLLLDHRDFKANAFCSILFGDEKETLLLMLLSLLSLFNVEDVDGDLYRTVK